MTNAATFGEAWTWLTEPSVCPLCSGPAQGGRPCDACATTLSRKWEDGIEREARADRVAAFLATLPQSYRWAANGDHIEIQLRVRPSDLAAVLGVESSCPMLTLFGRAGTGKTVCATARARRLVDAGDRVVFVGAQDLASAQRESRLGQSFDFLERAKRAPVAILDDLGTEPGSLSDAVIDLVFTRHAQARRTIITTGLVRSQITARYGDGLLRRVSERGRAVVLCLGPSSTDREEST